MAFVLDPPRQPQATVASTEDCFPINRIYCVGRNYRAHIREMGLDPAREPPFFFQKPADAYVRSGTSIPYPANTANLQFEIELVVAIGKAGRGIAIDDALYHVWGYAVGVDLTRRDRQLEARDRGRPWEVGKSFDYSAPMSDLVEAGAHPSAGQGRIWLSVNGEMKQDADRRQMIWTVPEIIASLSQNWELRPGDLIFTGTPEGVGPLVAGDKVRGGADGLPSVQFDISPQLKD